MMARVAQLAVRYLAVLSAFHCVSVVAFYDLRNQPKFGSVRSIYRSDRPAGLASTPPVFDFSSPTEWNTFYRDTPDTVTEWHSSVSFDDQLALIPAVPGKTRVLMVGCGNSRLPETLARHDDGKTMHVTCLDSSRACIEQLQEVHKEFENMDFACGDAVELSRTLQKNRKEEKYDVIFDKGMIDALMCDEGWNGPLERLLKEAATQLSTDGRYILISYKLATSTKDFIQEVRGLAWTFDVPGSNDRVSVSIGRKAK